MLDSHLKNLEVVDSYYQNDFQEIYICKHKEENAYYLLNLIRDKEIFYEVDFNELLSNFSCIKDIVEVDEGILVISEYYFHMPLLEYMQKNGMTLTKQINNTTNIIDTLPKLKTLSASFIVNLFNQSNLVVDGNGNIKSSGIILLNPKTIYASIEDILATIANTIHILFTNKEIVNGNISQSIPPDIRKVINKCLSYEYLDINDLVSDYKSTSTYKLINPEREDIKQVSRMRKSMTRSRINYNIKTKGVIIALLLIPTIVWGSISLLKNFKDTNDIVSNKSISDIIDNIATNDDEKTENINLSDEDNQKEDSDIEEAFNHREDLDKFFTEDKINSLNEKRVGVLDFTKYHRGEYALKVHNESKERASYLIGFIDFEDTNFAYAKNRTVNLSLWLNSDKSTECSLILKLESKDTMLSQVVKKANVKANTWTLHNAEINTKNGDYLKIFINIEPNDAIWVDTMDIDILK